MKNLFSSSSSFYCLLLTVFAAFSAVRSDSSDHRYKQGDIVPLYANKVGPFHNPRYLDLKPFHCISSLFFFSSLLIVYCFRFSFSQRNLPLFRPSFLSSRFVSLSFFLTRHSYGDSFCCSLDLNSRRQLTSGYTGSNSGVLVIVTGVFIKLT